MARLLATVLTGVALAGCAACSGTAPPVPRLVLEVYGTKDAMNRFGLSSPGLTLEPETWFARNHYMRRLSGALPLDDTRVPTVTLTATRDGVAVSERTISLKPCRGELKDGLSADWTVVEKHSLALYPDGSLYYELWTDPPSDAGCSLTSPDGRDSKSSGGIGFIMSTDCGGDTDVRRVTAAGETVPTTCTALYDPKRHLVELQFIFGAAPDIEEGVSVNTCVDAQSTFPIDSVFPVTPSPCRHFGYGLVRSQYRPDFAQAELEPLGGTWTTSAADLSGKGKVAAELHELVFKDTDGASVIIRGKVDLSLARAPWGE